MEEIGRIGNAPEIKAQRGDPWSPEQAVSLSEGGDRGDAEQGGGVGEGLLGEAHAFERERRDTEFEGGGGGENRDERHKPPRIRRGLQRQQRPTFERQVEQETPDDRVDAKERHPADVQVPIGRRGESPQRHDD